MGHGKHLDCNSFPNHLYNTDRAFPNLTQVALLSLLFLPIASLPHHSYHFPSVVPVPSPISNSFSLFNFSSLDPLASQIMVDRIFLLPLADMASNPWKQACNGLSAYAQLCSSLVLWHRWADF